MTNPDLGKGEATPLTARARLTGDLDYDGVVTANDATVFQDCFGGPGVAVESSCADADPDADGDVDISDVTVMQPSVIGNPPPPPPQNYRYDFRNQMVSYTDPATGERTDYRHDALGRV